MRAVSVVVLVLMLGVVSCSKCSSSGAGGSGTGAGASAQKLEVQAIEQMIPKKVTGAVVAPSLGGLGQKLKLLEKLKAASFLGQLQGFATSKEFADALVAQVGVDIRSAEALEKAGLDAKRGLAVVVTPLTDTYAIVPVRDVVQFEKTVTALAAQRLGASVVGESKQADVPVRTFSVPNVAQPKLGYVLSKGYAFIGAETAVSSLGAASKVAAGETLADDATLKGQRERLKGEADVFAYVPEGAAPLNRVPVKSVYGIASLSASGFSMQVDAPVKEAKLETLSTIESQPATDLTGVLPRDAFLVARYTGDPKNLGPMVTNMLGAHLARAFNEAKFDVNDEILKHLKPGAAVALSLAEKPPMDKGMPTSFDVRSTNPFSYAHLTGVAEVASNDVALPVLEKVSSMAPKFGAKMVKQMHGTTPVFMTTYSAGEGVHFATKGPNVLFGSPMARVDGLLAAKNEGGSPVGTMGSDAVTIAVDFHRLAESVRALPESAWGVGGFAIKATTVRWLDATDDIRALSISVGSKDQVVHLRADLSLALAGEKAP